MDEDGKTQVPRFTHRELSRMIGSSREIVGKILKELEKFRGKVLQTSLKHDDEDKLRAALEAVKSGADTE